jgi:hypothetical protein
MKKGRLKILIVFLVGGLIGYIVGAGYSGWWMKSYFIDYNSSYLTQQVLRLAMLQNDNIDGCIASIEQTLDNCVLQIGWANRGRGGRIDPNNMPLGHLRALQAARAYTDAGYDVPFSDDSAKILSQVEPFQKEYCSPDLRSLQERASQRVELKGSYSH